jgi:hypothetical protein
LDALHYLEASLKDVHRNHSVSLLASMFNIGELHETQPDEDGWFKIDTVHVVSHIVSQLLTREPEERQRGRLFLESMRASDGLFMPARILAEEVSKRTHDPARCLLPQDEYENLKQACLEKFKAWDEAGRLITHKDLSALLSFWHSFAPAQAQSWAEALITSKEGVLLILRAHLTRYKETRPVPDEMVAGAVLAIERLVSLSVISGKIEGLELKTDEDARAIDLYRLGLEVKARLEQAKSAALPGNQVL